MIVHKITKPPITASKLFSKKKNKASVSIAIKAENISTNNVDINPIPIALTTFFLFLC